jgi:GAF domain-containing protein
MKNSTTPLAHTAVMESLVRGTSSLTGSEYFEAFAKHLCSQLQIRFVFVGEVSPDGQFIRTLANVVDGEVTEEAGYPLKGTPCEGVLAGSPVVYRDKLRSHFPDQQMLKHIQAESYIGFPLANPTGQVIGHVVLMDDKPMTGDEQTLAVIQPFASRTSTELERHRHEQVLNHRLAIEGLVTSISTSFINLAPDEIDAAISTAIEHVGRVGGVDRSWIIQFSEDTSRYTFTHEWCREGAPPFMEIGRVVVRDACPLFQNELGAKEVLHLPSISALPDSMLECRESLKADGIKSLLTVPLVVSGRLLGALGLDTVRQENTWSDEDIRMLQMAAEIIAQAFERQYTEQRLRQAQGRLVQAERMAALGQITAGLAHEFNTPAGTIQSGADTTVRTVSKLRQLLLESGNMGDSEVETLNKYLRVLEDNGRMATVASSRIDGLVRSLQRFTRLDEAEYQLLDLHDSLEDTVSLLQGSTPDKVKIVREYGTIPSLRGCPAELNQVFMTLLKNAIEARQRLRHPCLT